MKKINTFTFFGVMFLVLVQLYRLLFPERKRKIVTAGVHSYPDYNSISKPKRNSEYPSPTDVMKAMVTAGVTAGIEAVLFGNRESKRGRWKYERTTKTDNRYYARMFNNPSFVEEANAVNLLAYMREELQSSGLVTVSDFLDFQNQPTTFRDRKYGWVNLDGARIREIADQGFEEYIVELPTPEALNE